MENDSAQGSWTQTLQFCSHSHQPRLSSWGSSRLCSPSVGFQGKWLQTEFCVLALQVAVCISSHLSLVDRSSTMFYSWILSGFLSQMWCFRMGSPTWGLEPPLLRGKPPAAEISLQSFSCHPWEPSQPSRVSSVLPTSLVVVKWFLLSALGYKDSLQLVFSWLFRMISLQFSCNSSLVPRGSLCSFHLLFCHLGLPYLYQNILSLWKLFCKYVIRKIIKSRLVWKYNIFPCLPAMRIVTLPEASGCSLLNGRGNIHGGRYREKSTSFI